VHATVRIELEHSRMRKPVMLFLSGDVVTLQTFLKRMRFGVA